MIIDKDNFKLLIEALDFWVKDCVLPVIPKNRISTRKVNKWTDRKSVGRERVC